ncbi:hypothetical protein B0F90DRAFT_1679278 [Multifurca ochricompacta]|uniref:RING-type domain-containing protein n=1 Tax=Multifurca ochricompacta TaxID=376703 RepID=A0AAD4MDR6_9AGAM|nr:hypothetical protein B0F90DRAFT_1679278 [Multifurca ochricompacta]
MSESEAAEDEFDQLPDPFVGIDWSTVPGLSNVSFTPQPNYHNVTANDPLSTPTQYSYDEIDAEFLAEIDKVERRLLPPRPEGLLPLSSTSKDRTQEASTYKETGNELTSRYFHDRHAKRDQPTLQSATHEKVRRAHSHAGSSKDGLLPILEAEVEFTKIVHELSSPSTRESTPQRHKGKQKESSREILEEVLNSMEDEMICPICCDIFAFAHLGNPCGHTFCGGCGWHWIKKNREAPSCAICRASLSVDAPMIPNFAVDNAVEKHILALRISGIEGWETDGTNFIEWQARREKWKADSTKRAARKSTTASFSVFVAPYGWGGSAPSGSDYIEEEAESSGSSAQEREREQEEQSSRRRGGHNYHHRHHRRSGRQNHVTGESHDGSGRSGSVPRGRRSRRRRR